MTHKKIISRFMYQVKQRGYDTMKDSCLREEDLANFSDQLGVYKLKHGICLVWTCSLVLVIVGLKRACPALCRLPFLKITLCQRHVSGQLGWDPWMRDFFCCLWFGLFLLTLAQVILQVWAVLVVGSVQVFSWAASATLIIPLKVCTVPQQHCGTSLLYEQGCTSEVLQVTLSKLGLGLVQFIQHLQSKLIQLIRLIEEYFPIELQYPQQEYKRVVIVGHLRYSGQPQYNVQSIVMMLLRMSVWQRSSYLVPKNC